MDARNSSLELEVRSQGELGIPAEVLRRATLMLRAVLEKASASGQWLFRVTGECRSLEDPSQYRMRIDDMVRSPSMVYVALRPSLMHGGTIEGMLKPPPEVSRDQYFGALGSAVAGHNQSRWGGVLASEQRDSMVPGQSGLSVNRKGQVKSSKPFFILSAEQALVALDTIQLKLKRAVARAKRRGQDAQWHQQRLAMFVQKAKVLRATLLQ